MGILNKRNAVIGWSVWQVGKRVAKRKVKQAAPRRRGQHAHRPKKGAIVSGLAATGGALWFWRRRRRGDDEQSPPD
jgi:hypothetical protein